MRERRGKLFIRVQLEKPLLSPIVALFRKPFRSRDQHEVNKRKVVDLEDEFYIERGIRRYSAMLFEREAVDLLPLPMDGDFTDSSDELVIALGMEGQVGAAGTVPQSLPSSNVVASPFVLIVKLNLNRSGGSIDGTRSEALLPDG